MVCVSGMHVWSICEHHPLPFWCEVTIGYIPQKHVLGLSKFARIAHQFAHRLYLQEQLGEQIADEICLIFGTNDVAVILKGEHICMSAHGIRIPALMTSLVTRSCFRESSETRLVFLRLVMPSP